MVTSLPSPSNKKTMANCNKSTKKPSIDLSSNSQPTPKGKGRGAKNGGNAKKLFSHQQQFHQPGQQMKPSRIGGSTSSGSNRSSRNSSPTNGYFAGSKCYDAPTPSSLPQPPSSWLINEVIKEEFKKPEIEANPLQALVNSMQKNEHSATESRDSIEDINQHLKQLLNVKA